VFSSINSSFLTKAYASDASDFFWRLCVLVAELLRTMIMFTAKDGKMKALSVEQSILDGEKEI